MSTPPVEIAGTAIDGEAVAILRVQGGWTATALAAELGISLTYLGDIEKGRRTLKRNPPLRKRIADTLGVPQRMVERRP